MIERVMKYLKVLYKGASGMAIELVYPLVIFTVAGLVSFLFYLLVIIKK